MADRSSTSIQLTVLRQGELNIVDLAEVGSLIPRSETRVDDAFLRELVEEMRHLGGGGREGGPGVVRDLERIGALVFSHLLTEPARQRLRSAPPSDLHLRLDESLIDVPWELCHDGQDFLAMKHRVGRQVITGHPIPAARPDTDRRGALRVLVIADPSETLPQAGEEAEQLCALLDGIPGVEVTLLGGKGVRRIPLLAALQEHDVAHFAGHSHYEAGEPARSGWRLHDGVLTAGELSKLRPPPLLVFSNSCEAGTTTAWDGGYRYEGHAFGIGSAFLLAGVRNYVGTFWIVHDEESVRFATSCYGRLAAGDSLGAALLHARHAVAGPSARQGLTWAGYLLYGDPTFAPLPSGTTAPPPDRSTGRPVESAEGAAGPAREAYRFDVRVAAPEPTVEPLPIAGAVAAPAPLVVGREPELAELQHAFDAACAGERGVVFIGGPPGIGKTTLVDAFVARVRAAGALVGHGQAVEQYGTGEAYLPMLEVWGRLGRGLVDPLRRHAPTWLAQLPGLLEPAEYEAVQRRAQASTRERMMREMAELLEAVAAERPLVLVLEDLHWSDHSTLELVAYVAQRRQPARLLVVGTYRPAELGRGGHPLRAITQELAARGLCVDLRLEPLAAEQVGDYLRGRLRGGALDAELTALIHRRTDGHPLFLVNVVEFALRQGLLVEHDGRWHLPGGVAALAASVPDTLRRMIDRQIEALTPVERQVLEAASIAGSEFTIEAVAAALEQAPDALEECCEALAWQGRFIRSLGVADWPDGTVTGRYAFVHALYQNILYERVSEARRTRLHRRIAERKAAAYGTRAAEIAGELASHFQAAHDGARAVVYHTSAGDNAVRRHAAGEAIAHFTRARELLATLPDTAERGQRELELLVKLATPLMAAKGYAAHEVERVFERAHALSRQVAGGPHLSPLLRGMASFYQVRGESLRAREVGDELLALCADGADPIASVQAHYGQGVTLYNLGEIAAAVPHIEAALAGYDPATHATHVAVYGGYDPGVACRCWQGWLLWEHGAADRAPRAAEEGLVLAERLGDPFTITFAHLATALLRLHRGEAELALRHLDAVVAEPHEEVFPYHLALARGLRGWALLLRGRIEESLVTLQQGLRGHDETGARMGRPSFLALMAGAEGLSGRHDVALRLLDEALAEASATHQRLHLPTLHRSRGTMLLWSGDDEALLDAAEASFVRAVDAARTVGSRALELQTATSLAALWRRRGRVDEARALLAPLYEAFEEGHTLAMLRDARAVLGHD